MAGPEALLTRKVLAWLRARPGSYTVKIAGGPHQTRGLPDVLHLERGMLYALEIKAPAGRLTALQELALRRLEECGAVAGVVRSIEDVERMFAGDT